MRGVKKGLVEGLVVEPNERALPFVDPEFELWIELTSRAVAELSKLFLWCSRNMACSSELSSLPRLDMRPIGDVNPFEGDEPPKPEPRRSPSLAARVVLCAEAGSPTAPPE